MTAGCSIHAMSRMAPAHWGHPRGSTSYTCLMSHAHARFASEGDTSLESTMAVVASPGAVRRFPRPTVLYPPESRTRCSPAFGMCAVSAASQSHAEHTSQFRFSTGGILNRSIMLPVFA